MSEIKRFDKVNVSKDPWQEYCGMTETEDGDFVRFDDHAAIVAKLEQELAAIKQQFIKYENSDAYELDMMIEYVELKTLIMSIKESSK